MEIQDRLFSETSEEVYYSVLMNEEEYSLYSVWSDFLKKAGPNFRKLKSSLKKAAGKIAYIGPEPEVVKVLRPTRKVNGTPPPLRARYKEGLAERGWVIPNS